jgi:hypothetical protein
MNKKITARLLAILLTVIFIFSMTGCGKSSIDSSGEPLQIILQKKTKRQIPKIRKLLLQKITRQLPGKNKKSLMISQTKSLLPN